MKKLLLGALILVSFYILFAYIKSSSQTVRSPFPQQYLDDRTNYANAVGKFNEAMDLTAPPDRSGNPFTMQDKQQGKIIADLKEGIALSGKVGNDFLDYLHPEMEAHYRNEYVRGYTLILAGIQGDTSHINSAGVKEQLDGSNLIGVWNKWWNPNKDEITNKAFPE